MSARDSDGRRMAETACGLGAKPGLNGALQAQSPNLSPLSTPTPTVQSTEGLTPSEPKFTVAGISPDKPGPPFHWYVIEDGIGEVAYCQTENGEEHARMIAAALNDRFNILADSSDLEDLGEALARVAELESRMGQSTEGLREALEAAHEAFTADILTPALLNKAGFAVQSALERLDQAALFASSPVQSTEVQGLIAECRKQARRLRNNTYRDPRDALNKAADALERLSSVDTPLTERGEATRTAAVGDLVKVRLATPFHSERVWARITAIGPVGFTAAIDNDPVADNWRRGDLLDRAWDEVSDHIAAKGSDPS